MTIIYRTVYVPAYAGFASENLIEGQVLITADSDNRPMVHTTGLCQTIEEAQERAQDLEAGRQPRTQAPNYQANESEMASAAAQLVSIAIKDGGMCHAAIERAIRVGIHTVEWAIASRYLIAGWV